VTVNDSKLETSNQNDLGKDRPSGWLRTSVVAAASALAGGMVAAWWYRKTLKTLRETEETRHNPNFGIHGGHDLDES
jgi:hypothetical protein